MSYVEKERCKEGVKAAFGWNTEQRLRGETEVTEVVEDAMDRTSWRKKIQAAAPNRE